MQEFLLFAKEHYKYTSERALDLVIKDSKASRFSSLLQKPLIDEVGHLIRPSGREDLDCIREGDLLLAFRCGKLN